MIAYKKLGAIALGLLFMAGGARAHDEPLNLEGLMEVFGWDFSTAEIRTEQVSDTLYLLFGVGGNVGVSVGPQGVLIVDDQFPQMIPKIGDAIRAIGGGGVDFAVNTHWHFDHAEGNLALGPGGTWLVSQSNSREMMLDDYVINLVASQYMQEAYPESALPSITFDDEMQFHFNGEEIELKHFGPAHTTGDTAVFFRGSKAVHLGDVFNRSFPFIDADNGGDVSGMINFCQAVLDDIEEDWKVMPGHGEISDYEGLKAYIAMLTEMREVIGDMVAAGKTLEEVIAAKPTAKYDAEFGDSANFVNRVFTSLTKEMNR